MNAWQHTSEVFGRAFCHLRLSIERSHGLTYRLNFNNSFSQACIQYLYKLQASSFGHKLEVHRLFARPNRQLQGCGACRIMPTWQSSIGAHSA